MNMLIKEQFLFICIFAVLLSDQQDDFIDDNYENLSQIQPSDITGPPVVQSPYFGTGRKSGGTKRKRAGGERKQAGGEKKLTKRGKWLGKKSTKESGSKKVPFSANRNSASAGSSFSGTPSGYRANPAPSTSRAGHGGGGAMGLLAPPRPRSVKRE